MLTVAIVRLSLDRACEAGNVMFDEERVGDRHWDRAEQRARHQRSPEEDIATYEFGNDADGHRLLLGAREEHERVDELVPREREGEDAGRENARNGDGDDDVEHGLPSRGAVYSGAFLELLRHGLE